MKRLDDTAFLMESHRECLELKRQIELDGLPADPDDVRWQFVQMVDNAEALRVAFGGHADRRAVDDAYALVEVIRAASRAALGATHDAPRTRH